MTFIPSKETAVSSTVILHLLFLYISISYKDGVGQIQRFIYFLMGNYVGIKKHCMATLYPEGIEECEKESLFLIVFLYFFLLLRL